MKNSLSYLRRDSMLFVLILLIDIYQKRSVNETKFKAILHKSLLGLDLKQIETVYSLCPKGANGQIYYNYFVSDFYAISTNCTLSMELLETSNRDYAFVKRNIDKKFSS